MGCDGSNLYDIYPDIPCFRHIILGYSPILITVPKEPL